MFKISVSVHLYAAQLTVSFCINVWINKYKKPMQKSNIKSNQKDIDH